VPELVLYSSKESVARVATTFPTISVLIHTYNRADFLQQALESARKQDYPHLEIVVSDNGSTDATSSLQERYRQDPRIRWYRNEPNIGLAGNWRKLLYEYARTDFVKILADDDYLENPKHLSQAAELIQRHRVDVVFAGAGSYDDETHMLVSRSWVLPELLAPAWWMSHIGQREGGKTLFPNLTTSGLFRLSKAKSLQAFIDPVFGMDYQLGLELMLSGPSVYLSGIHGVERKHRRNDGFDAPLETVISCLKLYDRVLAYGLSQGLPEADVRAFCRRFMTVMINGFVVYTWSRERGASPRSLAAFYRALTQVDPRLGRAVLISPRSLIQLFLGGSPERQERLRRLYYQFCRWRKPFHRRTPVA
jgi:glycosyltransferase involved in cell wall biosynthesis